MTTTVHAFPFGQLYQTSRMFDAACEHRPFARFIRRCITRHLRGDWGDCCDQDRDSNDIALQGGGRLFSVYEIPQGLFALESKIWIITEADRSYTTVLFPSEYWAQYQPCQSRQGFFHSFFHIFFTIQLAKLNKQSRPVPYVKQTTIKASLSSRFMLFSGIFLLAFIIFHLLHFTVGSAHPQFSHTDVYRNIVIGFTAIPAAIFYILAMISLGFHLNHGAWSLFQTLGINHPKINCYRKLFAIGISILIPLAYMSIPIAVLLGVLN